MTRHAHRKAAAAPWKGAHHRPSQADLREARCS
eukprot:CAMPEP_0181186798 /NCGR_PEP_ID=MMETSP1096-20121128/10225_1 /TAXON_ID=156174 ORGANISM="Chrysochromulina ericina, Strain CCMP281" /NCGR_SAMPLE_ID=MMETSP1096 /ASSEMBLY_ACC=CAM_ASM_000453 /LENGTH=32 /DNA_ID= /DNA_START= /DNA_END= /DNA_ORIENTATION=